MKRYQVANNLVKLRHKIEGKSLIIIYFIDFIHKIYKNTLYAHDKTFT